jgi:hypothetical protein
MNAVKLTAILILIGAFILGGVFLLNQVSDNISIRDSSADINSVTAKQLTWDNITLEDHTVYNADGSCTATKNGMSVYLPICNVNTMSGRNIQQEAVFTTNRSEGTTYLFIYEGQLQNAKLQLYHNYSHTYSITSNQDQYVNNYLVDKIINYTDLGNPDSSCTIGNTHNTRKFLVNRALNGTSVDTNIYCFTSVSVVNATAFSISGNITQAVTNEVTGFRYDYEDISNIVEDITSTIPNQLKKNFTFYKINDVSAGTYNVKWIYTPENQAKSGKFHIISYPTSKGISQAYSDNDYMYQDPSWTSSFNDGLKGFWKLNETSGTRYDSLGINNITVTGTVNGAKGLINGSWQGNDNGNYGTFNVNPFANTSAFTLSYWYNCTGFVNSGKRVIGTTSYNIIEVQTNNHLQTADGLALNINNNGGASLSTQQTMCDSKWRFILITATSGGVVNMTINGTQYGTSSAGTFSNLAYTKAFGWDGGDVGTELKNWQYIDEVGIWNRTLNSTEISDLYNAGVGITYQPLGGSSDTEYPQLTSQVVNPTNNTVYSLGANYTFNVTITSTNSTAGLSFNGVNYSMSNITTMFNKTLSNLGAGTYPYYYWAYGNGTSHNYNSTSTLYYTVAKANGTVATYLNHTRGVVSIINGTSIYLNVTLVNGTGGTLYLYNNGTIINSGSSPLSNLTTFSSPANYTILGNYSGNANFTSGTENWTLIVLQGITGTIETLTMTPASPITYGTQSNFSCSNNGGLTSILYIDGVDKSSQNSIYVTRGAGTYTVNCTAADSGFYLGNSTQSSYTINPQSSSNVINFTIVPSSNVVYPTQTNVTGNCNSEFNCSLYRDGVLVTNPENTTLDAGTYNYSLNINSLSNNYTNNGNISTLVIVNKTNTSISLAFSPANLIENTTVSTVTCTAPIGTINLTRNGVQVSNPDVQTLGVGNYSYNCSIPSSTNWNANSTTSNLTVINILYAGTSGNVSFNSTALTDLLYFQVPYNFVTRAYANLTSSNSTLCYQESANVSTACGGLSTGTYLFDGSGNYSGGTQYNFIDGDWNTFTESFFINNYLYVNYSKPINSYNATINYKFNSNGASVTPFTNNITLPNSCFNNNLSYVSIRYYDKFNNPNAVGGHITCFNITGGYSALSNDSDLDNSYSYSYEESITWNIKPLNLNISLNQSQIFYQAGMLNQTTRTSNFYNILNNYLSSCTYTGSYCTVPINFSSSTSGDLTYSDVVIDNHGFIENGQSYSNNTFETEQKNFSINISYDSSEFTLGASLVYNNTDYPATVTTTGYNATVNRSLLIPTGVGNKTFYWKIALTNVTGTYYFNSTSANITVSLLNMSLCGSPYTIPFINYTFHNETTAGEAVSATFTNSFTYWLSNPSVNKTYSFVNATQNFNYTFCFTPSASTIYLADSGTYDNLESQQRSFSNSSMTLTNRSIIKDLLLLPNSDGIYITFVIQNQGLSRVSNALISIIKTSDSSPVEQKYTDGTGLAAFWLDTGTNYGITVTASGYDSYGTSLTPATSPVTYTLTATSSGGSGGNQGGITYTITPSNNKLSNATTYTFTFDILSRSQDLDEYGFSLWNSTSQLTSYQIETSDTTGSELSLNYNTGNQSYITLKWYYIIDGDYTNGTKKYFVVNTAGTDNSIAHLFDDIDNFIGNDTTGILGIKKGDTNGNFSLAIIIFLITFFLAGSMTYKYGITSLTATMFTIFSVILFFDIGVGLMPDLLGVPHFITIFTGVVTLGLFIRESTI